MNQLRWHDQIVHAPLELGVLRERYDRALRAEEAARTDLEAAHLSYMDAMYQHTALDDNVEGLKPVKLNYKSNRALKLIEQRRAVGVRKQQKWQQLKQQTDVADMLHRRADRGQSHRARYIMRRAAQ